jgi:carnitine 3-dehydrogenase
MRTNGLKVAVVGCGLIGESWAALFKAYGLQVVAWDPDHSVRERITARIENPLAQLRELGRVEKGGSLHIADTLGEAVENADWIQENAPESVALKHDLYREIEVAAPPESILASSTSSLTWSNLATSLRNKARLIIAHPFNPPHLMPLVELYGTDPAILERAKGFYGNLGRTTVTLNKEAIGHIANRLSSALWREAVNIVAEGIAGVSEVDTALMNGPGLRWSVVGAHMAYHLGGGNGGIEHYLKHLGPSQEQRWASLGSPSLTPETCAMLIAGIVTETEGRSVATLTAERDQILINVLKARKQTKDTTTTKVAVRLKP